jgi:hypothetical protein
VLMAPHQKNYHVMKRATKPWTWVLRKIFGLNWDEVTGERRRLHNEVCDL